MSALWQVTLIIDPCRVCEVRCEPCEVMGFPAIPEAEVISDSADAHLHQRVERCADGTVVGRYVFDDTYARVHPQVLERDHLALLHGTIAAKLIDEAEILADDTTLAASLRWPSHRAMSVRLGRDGSRERGRGPDA